MVKQLQPRVVEAEALSLEEQKIRFHALHEWFSTPQGMNVIQAFTDELQPVWEMLYGETLLQLGCCGSNRIYCGCRYPHQWTVSPHFNRNATVLSLMHQLPVERESVDCVLAPLTLEASMDKDNLLDEVDRILKPAGHIVFLGINPISLWGLWLRYSAYSCLGNVRTFPWSVLWLKRAMLHRGYVQRHLTGFFYIPPFRDKKWIERLEILNETGKMISPLPTGFYCFVVQKLQENLTPLKLALPAEKYFAAAPPPLQPACRNWNDERNGAVEQSG